MYKTLGDMRPKPYVKESKVIKENFENKPNSLFTTSNSSNSFNSFTPNTLPSNFHSNLQHIRENYVHQQSSNIVENAKPHLELKYTEEQNLATSSPQVFGPPMWFTLHNAAAYYPENASPLTKERMKNVILGLPVLIPCTKCKEHATSYIEKHYNDLDKICSGRDSLFKFFVDFHNYVNQRYNKRIYTYDEAMKLYSGNAKVNKFSYS